MTNCLFKNTFIHLLWILCLSSIAPAQALSEVTTPSPSPTTAEVIVTSDNCAFIGGSFQIVATIHNDSKLTPLSNVWWRGRNAETTTYVVITVNVSDCSVRVITGDDRSRYSFDCDSTKYIYTMRINQVVERDLYTSWRFEGLMYQYLVISDPKPVLFCADTSTTLSSSHLTDATAVTPSLNAATTRQMTTAQRNSSTVTSNRTDSPWTSSTNQTETETQLTSTTPETTDTTPTLYTQTSASPSSYPSSAIASTTTASVQSPTTVTTPSQSKNSSFPVTSPPSSSTSRISATTKQSASSSTSTTSPSMTVTHVPSTSSTSFSTYGTSESHTSATLPPTTTLENSKESTSLNISTSHRSSPSTESSSITTSTLSYSTDDNMTHTTTYATTDTKPIVDVNITSDYCAFIGGSFQLVATVYNAKLLYRVDWIGLDAGTFTYVTIVVDLPDCSVSDIYGDDITRYSIECDSDNDMYTYTMRINQVEEKDIYTSWSVQGYTSQDAPFYDPKPVLFCGNVISIGVNVESSYYVSNYDPFLAVDGNISTNYSACHCCIFLYGLSETWLRLDLGHTYKISRVILYGGTDFPYDFSGMTIRLDSDVVHTITDISDWTGFLDLNMTRDHTARNVSITFDKAIGAVAICELLVFKGCDDYFFGVNCASQCHCDGSPCNILSGKCPSGRCQAGFSGETCSEYDNTTSTIPYPTTSTKPAVDCGVPEDIENGLANYTYTTVDSTASYTCSVGYNMIGDSVAMCKEDGKWLGIPYCEIIDCGPPPNLTNGEFSLVGGTTFSSIALYSCTGRFKLNSTINKRTCLANGLWLGDIGVCVPIACVRLPVPSDGAVGYTNNGNTAHFNCTPGFSLIGSDRLICLMSGSWSGQVPKCQTLQIEIQDCPKESDRQNTLWNPTKAGQTVTLDCPEGQEGIISRHCTVEGIWRLPRYTCVSAEISAAESTIDAIASTNVTEAVKSHALSDVLGTLSNSTTESTATENSAMVDGEIEKVTAILEKVASLSQDIIVTPKQSEDFIGTTSNLLNPGNSESFKSLEENKEESSVAGADKVLKVVGTFAKAMANSIDNLNGSKTITSDNLVLTVARLNSKNDIQFPEQSMDSPTGAHVPHNFLGGGGSYSGILYHNLSGLLPPRLEDNGNKDEENFQINGPVMDMQLLNTTSTPSFQITLSFENFQSGDYDSRCTFWNYNKSLWDTFGCFLNEDKTTSSVTVCACNHTTNFAILMNPSTTPNVDTKAIDYITIIGCSISFICLIITIVMYKILWRYLRSDRAVILMNLSVALILAYAVFIAGVDRTEYRAVCTGVAIALHYIYLVVFLLMLSEGIEIFITVVYVFIVKSRLRRLIGLSWGLPVIVVGISVGVTRTEGYGSNESCWLSSDGGLIWAFLGPALAVLLANYVLLAIVIKTMFKAKTLKQRSITEQVKTGIRCLCVLLPLTGCTWVIGVFYVNEGLAWTQYLFAVLNSLQGVVIMVFQCIFNSQMRLAISRRMGAYRASTAFTKPSNNQPRSSDGSSSYQGRFSSDTYNEELTEDYDRSLQNLHFNNIRTPASRHSDPHSTSVM